MYLERRGEIRSYPFTVEQVTTLKTSLWFRPLSVHVIPT